MSSPKTVLRVKEDFVADQEGEALSYMSLSIILEKADKSDIGR